MTILDAHIRRALFAVSVVVALALTGISGFITLVEELDDLGEGSYGLLQVIFVTALALPEVTYELFPLIVLLGTVMGLGGLAAGGELVVMQAAGISVVRIAWSAMKGGLVLGIVCLLLGDLMVPQTRTWADEIKRSAKFGGAEASTRGVWLREADNFIRIGSLPREDRAELIETYRLDPASGRMMESTAMRAAVFQGGSWRGTDVRMSRITPERVTVEVQRQAPWNIGLEPDLLRLFVLRADSLSLSGLHEYISYLDANDLDASGPRYAFWRKLSIPVTVLIMTLLAVPFVLGPLRDSGAGQRLFLGVMVGIGFYVANEVTASLGQVYGLAAPVAAFLPTVVLAGIAFWRLQTASAGRT